MTNEEFFERFQIRLTSQQKEAVCSVQGPVLLLAVPGSGKTTALVARLGYMIYCAGIMPENILTLTYTVAATHDMAARFRSYFGEEMGGRLAFRTINGICARIIQYYGRMIGKSAFSLVTDEKKTAGILSAIYQRVEKEYAGEGELKKVRTLITYIKNGMLTGKEIRQLEEGAGFRLWEIYTAYCGELRGRGLMDYDDQMTYAYAILRKDPETLGYFQDRYPFICVDEAQDTSKLQHAIVALLAGKSDNLFMVGDEDQSIYGFRAAYPEALLSFEKDHPGARVLLMEENFRSNAKIVEAADCFIRKNVLRHEKYMRAVRKPGADIRGIGLKGRGAQYSYLVKVAEDCRRETAVLYRDNESAVPLVDLLERKRIPYRIRSAELAFFTHRVVIDIQNIIRFAMNPGDAELFLQIYYKISTYISKENAVRICETSEKTHGTIMETAIRWGDLQEQTRQNCKRIKALLKALLSDTAEAALDRITRDMGYGDYLERTGMGDGKLFLLKMIARNESSPERLVERLAELQTVIREKENDFKTKFILSTVHASKGLEYDTVYLLDVLDGIFPEKMPEKQKSVKWREETEAEKNAEWEEQARYEEERRLFYVAMTRAKEMLCVFAVEGRSSFCREIMQEPGPGKTGQGKAQALPVYRKKSRPAQMDFSEYCAQIGEGLLVEHKKFGRGVIAEQDEKWVVIEFADGQRRFALRILYENALLNIHVK